MNKIFLYSLFVVAAQFPLMAAPDAAEKPLGPPTAPLVSEPRPGSQWEVTIQYSPGGESAKGTDPSAPKISAPVGRRATKILSHRGAEVTQTSVTWSDGTKTEGYVVGTRLFIKTGNKPSVLSTQEANLLSPVFTGGYPGTAWLTLADYKGIETAGKEECYKFVREARKEKVEDDLVLEAGMPQLTAMVRVADKTPEYVKMGGVVYQYSAIKPASTDVTLPAEFQEASAEAKKEQYAYEMMNRLKKRR